MASLGRNSKGAKRNAPAQPAKVSQPILSPDEANKIAEGRKPSGESVGRGAGIARLLHTLTAWPVPFRYEIGCNFGLRGETPTDGRIGQQVLAPGNRLAISHLRNAFP